MAVSCSFQLVGNRARTFHPHETFSFSLLLKSCKDFIMADVSPHLMCMKPPWNAYWDWSNNLCRHKHQRSGACWLVGDGGASSALRCMVVKPVLLCLPVCSGICASCCGICSQKTNWAVLTLLCTDANAMDRSSVPWTLKRNNFGSLQWSRPFQYCNIQLLQEVKG
jgi:hypothetical protein